jgi:predicted site-specific integrase-resolvase
MLANTVTTAAFKNPFNTVLDRNRERRMVFYGRVSTEHEAQLSALENQIQWYDDQAKYHKNWSVQTKYLEANIFLRTIFSLARLIGQTAHKAPVYADFLNPVPA